MLIGSIIAMDIWTAKFNDRSMDIYHKANLMVLEVPQQLLKAEADWLRGT